MREEEIEIEREKEKESDTREEPREQRGIEVCEETERKERGSSAASSSALRRHLNHVEDERRRGEISRQV